MANPFTAQSLLQPQSFRGSGARPGGFGMDIANRNAAQARQAQMQEEFKGVMASQDPRQVAAFSFKYPEAAQQAQQAFGIANQETQGLATTGYGKALQTNDPLKAADQLDAYADMVEAAGGTPVNMRGDAESLRSGDLSMNQLELGVAMAEPQLWDRFNKARIAQADEGLSDKPSAVQETEWFNKQTPEIQETHLKIKRGEKPTLDQKLEYEKSKAEIKEDSAINQARRKTSQERQQGFIDSGVSSADNLQTVKRSIELLDDVKTGGIDNALLKAKQLLGIESANEAELSYELGKNVLKQLKPTFGAAFTVNEMMELKRMEAGLGKSVAGNKRILKNLEKMLNRSAQRGMRAAKSLGEDFAANEIELALKGQRVQPEDQPSTTTVNWADL